MQTTTRLAQALRYTALAALLAVFALWLGTGAHRGWTQTSHVVLQQDEITGIEFPVRQPAFVAGLELLAVGVGFSAALAAASLLPARRRAAAQA